MKLKILGSGAAQGIPAPFCTCQVCQTAHEKGGHDIRRRTAYMWDDDIMIDLGPDFFSAQITWNLDYSKLRHVLITHSHADHFYPMNLYWRPPGVDTRPEPSWLTVHGNSTVGQMLNEAFPESLEECSLDFSEVKVGQTIELDGQRSATAIRAQHGPEEVCLNYILQSGDHNILIGNDTGWWDGETWQVLEQYYFDAAIVDCTAGTLGTLNYHAQHMNVETVIEAYARLLKAGAIDEASRVITTHFSHNGDLTHSQLVDKLAPAGVEVGYDGMEIEL